MNKLKNIIQGFWFWANPFTPKWIKEAATNRMDKCMKCPHNIQNVCELCGCFLPAKTRSPEEACPQLLWGKMEKTGMKKRFSENQLISIQNTINASVVSLKKGISKRGDGQYSGHTEFGGSSPEIYYSLSKHKDDDFATLQIWDWFGGGRIGHPVCIRIEIENLEQATTDILMPFFKYALKEEQ